jgi:nucleoid-associated protein YgaU
MAPEDRVTRNPSKVVGLFALALGAWGVTFWLWPLGQSTGGSRASGPGTPLAAPITFGDRPRLADDIVPTQPVRAAQPPTQPLTPTPRPSPVARAGGGDGSEATPVRTEPVRVVIPPKFFNYTVQQGDASVQSIARRLRSRVPGLSANAILEANPLVNPARLIAGRTVLRIPEDPRNIEGKVVTVQRPVSSGDAPATNPDPSRVSVAKSPGAADSAQTYTVRDGDTLSKISQRLYGRTALWERIYEANRNAIRDPARLKPGTVLTIPPRD